MGLESGDKGVTGGSGLYGGENSIITIAEGVTVCCGNGGGRNYGGVGGLGIDSVGDTTINGGIVKGGTGGSTTDDPESGGDGGTGGTGVCGSGGLIVQVNSAVTGGAGGNGGTGGAFFDITLDKVITKDNNACAESIYNIVKTEFAFGKVF